MTHTIRASQETIDQVEQTYKRLVTEAKYAPLAPSDGFGNIIGRRNTPKEAKEYVPYWLSQEDEQLFDLGCPDWHARPALIFTVEAARLINGMEYPRAIKLLQMAVAELEQLTQRRKLTDR